METASTETLAAKGIQRVRNVSGNIEHSYSIVQMELPRMVVINLNHPRAGHSFAEQKPCINVDI
uniref:Uncharacterized protein n=1 Tax=Rhizophora mucronata TaxID=61149 RepID=A0A2P2IR07_RHIMU